VDEDLCFECGVCARSIPCTVNAFIPSEDSYQRKVKAFFSNPYTKHALTSVPGRGTEEVKTNDVTGRVKRGTIGYCIEFGRPVPGCRFSDIAEVASALIGLGARFERNNPLTHLMDERTGAFPDDLMNVRILSAILEGGCTAGHMVPIIQAADEIAARRNVTLSIGIITRFDGPDGQGVVSSLADRGIQVINSKGNFGLGKPRVTQAL